MTQTGKGPWTGTPIGNPHATYLGKFSAKVADQSDSLRASIQSLSSGLMRGDDGFCELPLRLEINAGDTKLQGRILPEGVSGGGTANSIRMIISSWNGPRLEWAIVNIQGDSIEIDVRQNPKEPCQSFRKLEPIIVPQA